jgi:hypothetical protein
MPSLIGLINELVLGRNTWPPTTGNPPTVADVWDEVSFLAALRMSDPTALRQRAQVAWDAPYLLSPIPRLISRAKANMLYGEPPAITAANESDQENLNRIVEDNGLDSELHRAALLASSEGECWGRIVVAPNLLDVPILDFVTRARVIPTFHGRFLRGATFVTSWAPTSTERVRLLEEYGPGYIQSRLFRGSTTSLGTEIPLDSFEATVGIMPIVNTGFDKALVAFLPNSFDVSPSRGFSDYRGLEERFLALNESATVGHQNLRLAGRKRALVDAQYLRDGRLPAGDDVFVRSSTDQTMGDGPRPLQLLEYTFEADQLVAWIDHQIDLSLTFAGVAPQSVGRSVDAGAISGTALKLKMSHSLMEAGGTGRHFDRGLAYLLRSAAILDGRRTTEGGFGRRWQAPDENAEIERGDGLPTDDLEAAQILATWSGADAISTEEKVRTLHPEWPDEDVAAEVERIGASHVAVSPAQTPTPPRPAVTIDQTLGTGA